MFGKIDGPATIRIVWLLTAAVIFGIGIGLVWWPSSQAINALRAQAKSAYDEADQNDAEVRHAAELQAVERRVAEDVAHLSGRTSHSAVLAATLQLLYGEGRAFHVDVRSIVPAPAPSSTPIAEASSRGTLTGTPIEIDARGRFRDLLHFVADLPRHDVLVAIDNANLAGGGDRSAEPILNARINATVYRYHGAKGDAL